MNARSSIPFAACLLLAACATPPAPSIFDLARSDIERRAYASALQRVRPWLEPGADASDAPRVNEARLLLARVRLDCPTRGGDLEDPKFCERLARLPDPSQAPATAASASTPAAPASTAAPAAPASAAVPGTPPDPFARRLSLDLQRASLSAVFGYIGQAAGLDVIFDRELPTDMTLSLRLSDTTAGEALDKAALVSGLAWRRLDARSLIVYADTPGKQGDYQTQQVRAFYLEHAEAKFVAGSLRTLLRTRDITIDDKLNALVLRDTAEGLRLAAELIRLHDVPEPEVLFDVQVLEVQRSLLDQLGVQWPAQLGLSPLPGRLQSPGAAYNGELPVTLGDLLSPSVGRTLLSGAQALLSARRDDGSINTLASPRLRARNREKARILIGERVPNVTATSTSTGLVAESVSYVDVGLRLEVQPQVYAGDEVQVRVELEVSHIAEAVQTKSGSLAYRIGTRNASTVLRLRDGENQLLAGLIQDSEARNHSRVPGAESLPLLGGLFRHRASDSSKTEVVLSITPRIIRPIVAPRGAQAGFEAGTASGVRGRGGEPTVAASAVQPAQPLPPTLPAAAVPQPPASSGPAR